MHWRLKSEIPIDSLTDIQTVLLANRGISPADEASFFHPQPPLQICVAEVGLDQHRLDQAVTRLLKASSQHERVLIFGDYDADGICATAVLWQALQTCQLTAQPFIPDRYQHGYGMSVAALEQIIATDKPNLIITVDNGIVAHQAVAFAQAQGIEVIITDHHQAEEVLPPAELIIHSTQLAGVGVAWFLAKALLEKFFAQAQSVGKKQDAAAKATQLLDLVTIATVADLVPLTGANRGLVYHGLKILQKSQRPGIVALCQVAGIEQNQIDTEQVGFMLAPRLNAMGRLDQGIEALRLLCTKQPLRAQALAAKLNAVNHKRQEITLQGITLSTQTEINFEQEHMVILASAEFHQGVIGLIAGRLVEKYRKPAIVLAVEDDKAKASARSIDGVDITTFLRQVKTDLLELGGHQMAAGFSLTRQNLAMVTKKLFALAKEQIDPQLFEKTIELDLQLPLSLITLALHQLIQKLAPFGNANAEPIFLLPALTILKIEAFGGNKQHLRLLLRQADQVIGGIFWQQALEMENFSVGQVVDVAACLKLNTWQQRQNLQLNLVALRLHQQ